MGNRFSYQKIPIIDKNTSLDKQKERNIYNYQLYYIDFLNKITSKLQNTSLINTILQNNIIHHQQSFVDLSSNCHLPSNFSLLTQKCLFDDINEQITKQIIDLYGPHYTSIVTLTGLDNHKNEDPKYQLQLHYIDTFNGV